MKKRLLLVLAIGVSFAPTVWADGSFSQEVPIQHVIGPTAQGELAKDAPHSILCTAGHVLHNDKDDAGFGSELSQVKPAAPADTESGTLYTPPSSPNS